MSLKPCRECGKEVSRKAEKCPHCGVKWPAGRPLIDTTFSGNCSGCLGCLAMIILAIFALFMIGMFGH